MKLVYQFRSLLCRFTPEETAAGGLQPSGFFVAEEASKGHHLLDAVGIDVIAELFEVWILLKCKVLVFAEKERDH